jgi:hypothetical protein
MQRKGSGWFQSRCLPGELMSGVCNDIRAAFLLFISTALLLFTPSALLLFTPTALLLLLINHVGQHRLRDNCC